MPEQAQPEREELSALLEKHLSDTESPPSRDTERVILLRAYLDSLRGAGHPSKGARLLKSGHPGLTAEGAELAAALLDGLAIDPAIGKLLPRTYRRAEATANEVLSLAIELLIAGPVSHAREGIRERLAEIVAVEGGEGVFRTLAGIVEPYGKVPLLLALAAPATLAGAFDEVAALLEEAAAALPAAPEEDGANERHALAKARVDVLAADTANPDRASEAYRQLVDSFRRPEDVRAFEAFVESRPSAEERHRDRRWLFDFHARTAPSASQGDVLAAWARAEEDYGAPEEAIAVYERLFAAEPARSDALEAIARLRLDAGQYEAALEPLRALRERSDETGRRGMDLGIARLLLEELGRPLEAAEALGPLLAVTQPLPAAQEMAARLLADETVANEVSTQFDAIAEAAEPLEALRVFAFLVQESRAPARDEMEPRWLERIAALAEADPPLALAALLRVAPTRTADTRLWKSAEQLARPIGQRDAVSSAYWQVLESPELEPEQAEAVGRRFLAWDDEQPSDTGRLVTALLHVLSLAPSARWALDRVKLVMGAEGRWEELFDLYDRAIDAVTADDERSALLAEAAFAAKDLAGSPERAIRYLEIARTLRPDDTAVRTSLERLYEKHGQTRELIGLYGERLSSVNGFEKRQLRKKIAESWLDLGMAENAISVLEPAADEDPASTFDMAEVLERLTSSVLPAAGRESPSDDARDAGRRAIALLRRHYEETGRTGDVVRLAEASLALAPDPAGERHALRDLVAATVRHEAQTGDAMAAVLARVEAHLAEKPELAKIAYRALLVAAIRRRKQFPVPGDAAYSDARDAAWHAVDRLKAVLLDEGDAAAARRLLARASTLPFEHTKRRELLAGAAVVAAEHGEDRSEAIRLFARLFEGDPGDDVAAQSLAAFATLLDEEGQLARLAALYTEQGRIAGTRGRASEQRALWEKAAALWEADGSQDRAIASFERSAALGSEVSYEALARIYAGREAWPEASKALSWLTGHASADTRTERTMRLSEAYEAMGERALARACLEASRAIVGTVNPGPMTERLMALYRDDAIWSPLAELLAAEGRRSTEAKTAFLCEAADLFRSRLSNPERAAQLYAEAIATDPGDPALRQAHADVLEALGRWGEAAETLRAQVDAYGDARSRERALAHQRRARTLVRAGQPNEALGELRLAAEMATGDASVLRDLARVALDVGQVELAESTYRVLLLALHQKPKGSEPDAPDRARVFLDLGEIAARAGDSARAADMIDSAFDTALDQGDDPAPLEETLSARGRFDLLARALERRVRRATALAPRAMALGHLAAVHDQRLGRPADLAARIVEYTENVLREIDREPVAEPAAWAALASIPSALGDAGAPLGGRDRLAGLLASAITAISNGGAGAHRNDLTLALARMLLEPPARADDAIAALMALRASDPDAPGATELLASALEGAARWDDLAGLLREELESLACVESDERFARTALRLGGALEKAGRATDARRVYESVLDRRPSSPALLAELADSLERSDSKSTGEALEAWLAIDPAHAGAIAARLVKRRDADGDRSGVLRALEAGFAADPTNAAYRERLVGAYDESGQLGDAVRILVRAADAQPEGPALVALLEGIVDRQPAGAGATETALRLVDLLARSGDVKRARARLATLLGHEPAHAEALERAATLAAGENDWEAALDANRKLLAALSGSNGPASANAAAALVDAAEHVGRIADAREPMLAAAHSPEIARSLERVYEATGEKRPLAELLVERAGREGNASEKARLRLRAADLLLDAGLPAAAWSLIEAALAAEPESLDARFLEGRAQVAFGRPEDALAVLGALASHQQGKRTPLVGRAHFEIAKAYLMRDDLFEALEALDYAAAIDRRSDEIALLLGLVALDLGDEKAAERALTAITTMPPRKDGGAGGGADAATKALAFYHLASLAYAKGDTGKAKRLAARAVGAGDPAHSAARALLDRLEVHSHAVGSHAE